MRRSGTAHRTLLLVAERAGRGARRHPGKPIFRGLLLMWISSRSCLAKRLEMVLKQLRTSRQLVRRYYCAQEYLILQFTHVETLTKPIDAGSGTLSGSSRGKGHQTLAAAEMGLRNDLEHRAGLLVRAGVADRSATSGGGDWDAFAAPFRASPIHCAGSSGIPAAWPIENLCAGGLRERAAWPIANFDSGHRQGFSRDTERDLDPRRNRVHSAEGPRPNGDSGAHPFVCVSGPGRAYSRRQPG